MKYPKYSEMVKYLIDRGWTTWYHDDYWVHPKTIEDKNKQDFTNYGMNVKDAYEFDVKGKKPFRGQFLGYMGGLRW